MSTHFAFAPTPCRQAGRDVPFFFDIDRAADTLSAVENAGFDSLLVDDAGGDLANFDVASRLTRAGSSLTLQLSHSATSMDPLSTVRSLSLLARRALAAPALRVRVEAGRSYTVQFKDDLTEAVWQSLTHLPAQAVAGEVEVLDPAFPVETRRYYRVVTPAQP